jgi:Spy/CpxP family protein refolding chaperone
MVIAMAAAWIVAPAMGQTPTSKPALPSGYVNIAGAGYGTYEDLFKVCDLTAEQQKKIQDIEARKIKVTDDAKPATKAAQEAMTKAQADNNNDAMGKAITQYQTASKPVYEAYQKAQTELADVLTKEQKAKWKEYTILKAVKQWQQGVKFSDAQWDKIIEAYEKLAKDPAVQFWEITMKLNAKIEEILTPEQKAKKLLATRYALMNQSVHFTDDEVQKLVKIEDERVKENGEVQAKNASRMNELQQAAQEAYKSGDKDALAAVQAGYLDMNKAYTELNQKYNDKVQSILTDKQKAAWQDVQKKNPYWQWSGGGMTAPGGGRGAAVAVPPGQSTTPKK